jgi:hypothetical protein
MAQPSFVVALLGYFCLSLKVPARIQPHWTFSDTPPNSLCCPCPVFLRLFSLLLPLHLFKGSYSGLRLACGRLVCLQFFPFTIYECKLQIALEPFATDEVGRSA